MKKQKALIHIGAGYLQLSSIKYAKSMGLYVVVTDRNNKAPGIVYADRYEEIDGTDTASFIKLAHDIADNYDLIGALSTSDYGLMTVAKLQEIFSFPGASEHSVAIALDKGASKIIWKKNGLPVPLGWYVNSLDELENAASELGYPLIVKPSDSSGSRGVRSVNKSEDLKSAYLKASTFSPQVIIEQLVSGDHCDANGVFIDGCFHPCGIIDRFFSSAPFCYPVYGMQPSRLTSKQETELYKLLESAARLLGIDAGPVKGDMIYTAKGPVLLEIAPRFHGDVVTQCVTPSAIGINPVEAWVDILAGQSAKLTMHEKQYTGWKAIFSDVYGVVESVVGVEDALNVPGVRDVFVSKNVGDVLKPAEDNTAMCGFLWASSGDAESLDEIMKKAASLIHFKLLVD